LNDTSEFRIDEEALLVFENPVNDSDLPANALTWSLLSAPEGMTIIPWLGAILWTPTEAQGPSTNLITLMVTDDGSPPLSAIKNVRIIVDEVTLAPLLNIPPAQPIPTRPPSALTPAAASDVPVNALTFGLLTAPAGVTINPAPGAIPWTPTEAQGPSTNPITLMVTDNGSPPLSD